MGKRCKTRITRNVRNWPKADIHAQASNVPNNGDILFWR